LSEQVDKLAARLTDEYAGSVPDRVVIDLVKESYQELASARVTNFVPVLVDRKVRARIRAGYAATAS
jgi:hypothetical protein